MICRPCRVAGEANQTAIVAFPEGEKRNAALASAKGLHDLCTKACDCQHHVGVWVVR